MKILADNCDVGAQRRNLKGIYLLNYKVSLFIWAQLKVSWYTKTSPEVPVCKFPSFPS